MHRENDLDRWKVVETEYYYHKEEASCIHPRNEEEQCFDWQAASMCQGFDLTSKLFSYLLILFLFPCDLF